MKLLSAITKPLLLSVTMTTIALILLTMFSYHVHDYASPVMKNFNEQVYLNDERLLALAPEHLSTQYIHKVELRQSKVEVELKYNSMHELVQMLNLSLNELTVFCFQITTNIEDIIVLVGEKSINEPLYEIKLNRNDYEAGIDIQIKPLS